VDILDQLTCNEDLMAPCLMFTPPETTNQVSTDMVSLFHGSEAVDTEYCEAKGLCW